MNAALGQSLYLLTVLAHRFSYKFERYDIVLCGAFSSISLRQAPGATGKATKFELYLGASEDRLCQALVYLLDCVKQVCDFAERQHGHLLQSMLPPERYRDL